MAEQPRYDHMVEAMRLVAGYKHNLSADERDLLSAAYKSIVEARRSAWRAVNSVDKKAVSDSTKKDVAAKYQAQVKEEVDKWGDQVLAILAKLIPKEREYGHRETLVFYLKMQGDYYRYLAEVTTDGDKKKEYRNKAKESYETATEFRDLLSPANPIRLGLALNFSVFYYEIENNTEEACRIAKESFGNAVADLDGNDVEPYKDCSLFMQMLRNNLAMWTATGANGGQKVTSEPFE